MIFFRRKRKPELEPELTIEEMNELVEENTEIAKRYARVGNVSGMEMSLEIAEKYAQKLKKPLDSEEMARIKLMGYKRGEKLMLKREAELKQAGRIKEAQNAAELASIYGNEARILGQTLQH